ncbi:MAG: Uma2 family endonuclease [Deltaproteobacteria bacterium]
MATVLIEPQTPQSQRLLTAADLAALPAELPSGPVKYELYDGKLVLKAPPADEHSVIQHRIGIALYKCAEAIGLGEARSEVGVILRRNPDRVVGPDAALIAKRSLPVRRSPEGYLETIPELVVEIRSKNDSPAELCDKAQEYLQAGVQIVWIVEPQSISVTVFRPRESAREFKASDTLTAEGVIPGFKVPVAELFGE